MSAGMCGNDFTKLVIQNGGEEKKEMRLYAAVITGALVEVITIAALWLLTEMEIGGIFLLSVFGYFLGMAAVMKLTEPRKRKRTRWEMRTYDLKKDEYCLIEEKVS